MKPPRLQHLGRVAGLDVYLVNGQYIRDHYDIDFVFGGNEAIYPTYNPPGEIWIDNAPNAHDRMATALHEIVERDLMLHHGWSYDQAHDAASAAEKPFRRELRRTKPRVFDGAHVERAFVAWKKTRLAPGAPKKKHPRQLAREVDLILSGKPR